MSDLDDLANAVPVHPAPSDAELKALQAEILSAPSRFVSPADWCKKHPLPRWTIKSFLPVGIGLLIGGPGTGKSFFALDLALHIVLGRPWRACRVTQAACGWIAAEGAGSMTTRLVAAATTLGVKFSELANFQITGAVNLADEAQLTTVIESLGSGIGLIIVDTLTAASPTLDENSKEMQVTIAAAQKIQRVTGGTVLLIHHVGKDITKGARGWSGLTGAADFVIALEKIDEDDAFDAPRLCTVRKQRDAEDGLKLGYQLVKQLIGKDSDGDDMHSLFVRPCEAPTKKARSAGAKLTINRSVVLHALRATPHPWSATHVEQALREVANRSSRRTVREWLFSEYLHLPKPDGTYEPRTGENP